MNETILNGESKDIMAENIEQLKQLFPEVFAENSIDFDKLKAVLGEYVDDDEERYNFTWWGKSKVLRLTQTPSTGTLRPCPEESKDWDTTQNLYIEGDNLEVLKLLQKTYHNKVKMIYIDPPYNTGNDFIYSDDYKDNLQNYLKITGQVSGEDRKLSTNSESSGRYHTNWLNMMYPRLRLARNLLTKNGLIFLSIDENEVHNLDKIMAEIFGETNFVGLICLLSNPKGRSQDKYLATCHEYVLIYSKSPLEKGALSIEKTEEDLEVDYTNKDKNGLFRELELRNTHREFGKHNRPNLYYPFYIDMNNKVWLEEGPGRVSVYPIWEDGFEGCWTWGKDKAQDEKHLLVAKKVNGNLKVYRKSYAIQDGEVTKKQLKSIWLDKKYHTEKGQKVFNDLFDSKAKIFQSPKSIDLLVDLIRMSNNDDGVVLDFFSGSASTAHAVLQLNSIDSGGRAFVMVQVPEPTSKNSEANKAGFESISDIGKERIRRAGYKIKAELTEKSKAQKQQTSFTEDEKVMNPDDLDIGFKVFKLDSSNLRKWQPDANDLDASLFESIENFIEGRNELDVVYEIMLKYGIDLTQPIEEFKAGDKTVFSVGLGALMICLDTDITTKVAQEIVKLKDELQPEVMRAVFRDTGFKDDSAKTNTKEILRTNGVDEIVSI